MLYTFQSLRLCYLSLLLQKLTGSSSPIILVINKIDCAKSDLCIKMVDEDETVFSKRVLTCAVTGQGIEELESAISELIGLDRVLKGGRRWTVNQVSKHEFKTQRPKLFFSFLKFSIMVEIYVVVDESSEALRAANTNQGGFYTVEVVNCGSVAFRFLDN